VLGVPQDWFNTAGLRARVDPAYPEDAISQGEAILTRGATANGVYGLKMFPERMRDLDRTAPGFDWTAGLPGLAFVRLTRRDTLDQAISEVRARQTGAFRSTAAAGAAPRYSRRLIRLALERGEHDRALWTDWFAARGVTPLDLVHEDIAVDPQGAVDAVSALMGLDHPAPIHKDRLTLAVQRDGLSQAWRGRFMDEDVRLRRLDRLTEGMWQWLKRI